MSARKAKPRKPAASPAPEKVRLSEQMQGVRDLPEGRAVEYKRATVYHSPIGKTRGVRSFTACDHFCETDRHVGRGLTPESVLATIINNPHVESDDSIDSDERDDWALYESNKLVGLILNVGRHPKWFGGRAEALLIEVGDEGVSIRRVVRDAPPILNEHCEPARFSPINRGEEHARDIIRQIGEEEAVARLTFAGKYKGNWDLSRDRAGKAVKS